MSQETRAREAMKKFVVGDGLNDVELGIMLDFYTNAEETLGELVAVEPAYRFAYRDVAMNLERLRQFKGHRNTRG